MKPYKIVSFALEFGDYDHLKSEAAKQGVAASVLIRQFVLAGIGSPNGSLAPGQPLAPELARADRKADALIWIYPLQPV